MSGLNLRKVAPLAVVALAGVALWWAEHREPAASGEHLTGYVVADDVYMSSPVAGTLSAVEVRRGDRIKPGQVLFRVDPTVRAAQASQAQALIAASAAQVEQQGAALLRARADLAAAGAEAASSQGDLDRLLAAQAQKAGAVARQDIDHARASRDAALARRRSAQAQVDAAQAAQAAGQAQLDQARAGLTSARRELADLAPLAPTTGRVEDVMAKPGETVGANAVVVSIVPDDQVKIRFYVPQSRIQAYRPGRSVAVTCDGCASGLTARVEFVANSPEYTPPIIYSLDARQKLVFLVEALPANPRAFLPGQPIEVTLNGPAGTAR